MSAIRPSNLPIEETDLIGFVHTDRGIDGSAKFNLANVSSALNLDGMATQAPSNVAITGGSITGITDLAVADGGTGASTASDARVNLLPSYTANGTKILALNAGATDVEWVAKPTGTVTSVDLSAGTGISVTGGPITSSGSITVTNTAPDQTVAIAAGTGISVSGSYPSFTVTNSAPSLGGDVVGPASSTDNAVVRFDSTTGKLVQNSGVTISDADLLTTTDLTVNDDTVLGSSNTDTVNFNARVASDINPATDDTYDLGVTGHEWRNLNIDGTANIDSLVADTADINGGTIDGTTIGGSTAAAGAFTTLSATGAITPSQTSGIVGTTTNNNANAGAVGEYVTASLARNTSTLAVTTAFDVVSLSLTAGDWDVNGMVQLSVQTGSEVISTVLGSINTTSLTLSTQATLGYYESRIPITPSGDISFSMGPVRMSLSATTTVYLITAVTWAGGTGIKVGGTMAARRAR